MKTLTSKQLGDIQEGLRMLRRKKEGLIGTVDKDWKERLRNEIEEIESLKLTISDIAIEALESENFTTTVEIKV